VGLALSALGTYLFFDSVRVGTTQHGLVSGLLGYGSGGYWETTSMGIVFVPFFLGVAALFYDSRRNWAWGLTVFGVLVLAVEILSRIQFFLNTKLTHLLGMLALFAAGLGLMIRSFREEPLGKREERTRGSGDGGMGR
jgi:uncharacterized protein